MHLFFLMFELFPMEFAKFESWTIINPILPFFFSLYQKCSLNIYFHFFVFVGSTQNGAWGQWTVGATRDTPVSAEIWVLDTESYVQGMSLPGATSPTPAVFSCVTCYNISCLFFTTWIYFLQCHFCSSLFPNFYLHFSFLMFFLGLSCLHHHVSLNILSVCHSCKESLALF